MESMNLTNRYAKEYLWEDLVKDAQWVYAMGWVQIEL